jgi:hypothetical protein
MLSQAHARLRTSAPFLNRVQGREAATQASHSQNRLPQGRARAAFFMAPSIAAIQKIDPSEVRG